MADWKSILAGLAPTLGAAFGGPLGGAAGTIVARKLGKPDDTPHEDLQAAIVAATPEQIVELKKAELEFKQFLKENQIKLEEVHAADRANARSREVSLRDKTTPVLAFVVTGAFIAMAGSVLFGWAVAESTIAGTIIGYMSAKAEQVISYYFGSSAGSKAKTDTLAQMQSQK